MDNSFAPGIGKRLDGWPNRDLNPGAITALSPAVDDAMKKVLNAWGAGKFDPRNNKQGLGLTSEDIADLAEYLKSL